jgi:hypothetical protein
LCLKRKQAAFILIGDYMKIEEAIANIDSVISNANLNRQQHQILLESMKLIVEKCKDNDENGDKS